MLHFLKIYNVSHFVFFWPCSVFSLLCTCVARAPLKSTFISVDGATNYVASPLTTKRPCSPVDILVDFLKSVISEREGATVERTPTGPSRSFEYDYFDFCITSTRGEGNVRVDKKTWNVPATHACSFVIFVFVLILEDLPRGRIVEKT